MTSNQVLLQRWCQPSICCSAGKIHHNHWLVWRFLPKTHNWLWLWNRICWYFNARLCSQGSGHIQAPNPLFPSTCSQCLDDTCVWYAAYVFLPGARSHCATLYTQTPSLQWCFSECKLDHKYMCQHFMQQFLYKTHRSFNQLSYLVGPLKNLQALLATIIWFSDFKPEVS